MSTSPAGHLWIAVQRQLHRRPQAAQRAVGQRHASAVVGHLLRHQGQPQPGARAHRGRAADEPAEHPGAFTGRQPRPSSSTRTRARPAARSATTADRHRAAPRRAEGVEQQVLDGQAQPRLGAEHRDLVVGQRGGELDPVGRRAARWRPPPGRRRRRGRPRPPVPRPPSSPEASWPSAVSVASIRAELPRSSRDHGLHLLRREPRVPGQHVEVGAQRGERGAQLVARGGGEVTGGGRVPPRPRRGPPPPGRAGRRRRPGEFDGLGGAPTAPPARPARSSGWAGR